MPPLTFPEVRKGAVALSSLYVEQRRAGRLAERAVRGAGKRAAFATYYAPLHFLTLYHALEDVELEGDCQRLLDLGCGTGAAGAAVAARLEKPPPVLAVDRSGWALGEARQTLRAFGLAGRTRRAALPAGWPAPRPGDLCVLGWVVNECEPNAEARLLRQAEASVEAGARLVIAEPLAGAAAPWWPRWEASLEARGLHSFEARTHLRLPAFLDKLDRATGLRHERLGARLLVGPL